MFRTIPQTASANVLGLVLMAALTPSAAASSPTTSWDDWLSANVHRLQYNAESAIILGGAVLYQNRHTIAGVTPAAPRELRSARWAASRRGCPPVTRLSPARDRRRPLAARSVP